MKTIVPTDRLSTAAEKKSFLPLGDSMKPYRDLNTHLREAFGRKVYKIALSTPFTCPNRDGTKGVGGCMFCSGKGSGNFASSAALPIAEQLREAKKKVAAKLKEKDPLYIAYFQSFTSTYGPIDVQRSLFFAAAEDPEVAVLSVATRPDCLDDGVLELLRELVKRKPVWVELGLQTANEATAEYIGRAFSNADFERAVSRLKAIGIAVIVHLIVGLPGEDHNDEIQSVKYVSRFPVDGVKLHLLHVLKGTRLAESGYVALSFEEYVDRLTDLIRYLPPDVVIHRLTGDADQKELIAPLWSRDKKRVLNTIHAVLRQKAIRQGDAYL